MDPQSLPNKLILASTSPYRQSLLARLCVPFISLAPAIDESPLQGETTVALTERLALAKAESIAASVPDAFVIGSDQLAEFGGSSIGKPGSESRAIAQLLRFSGRSVNFHTSTAVICKASDFLQLVTVKTEVIFRQFSEEEARRYVALDQPLDCAGSFRSEAAGPLILQAMISNDPTAIIGLPLIALSDMLRKAGFNMP